MRQVRAIAAAGMAALWLGGCTPAGMAVSTGIDFVSLNATKKTLLDHAVSGITGEDCSAIHLSETGHYCPERVTIDRSNIYCYRTLAAVDCHYLPDPYRNGHTALASPPPIRTPYKERGWFDPPTP